MVSDMKSTQTGMYTSEIMIITKNMQKESFIGSIWKAHKLSTSKEIGGPGSLQEKASINEPTEIIMRDNSKMGWSMAKVPKNLQMVIPI